MENISLRKLLEAGCHFGHKREKWHPKASSFIYQEREGVHIIDLAHTKESLKVAAEHVKELGETGRIVMFVGTKRQAKGVVTDAAKRAGAPYLTNRWIGGFLTNWEEVKKNIDKLNRYRKEKTDGSWQKFPKHEGVKLEKDLRKLEMVYGGVSELASVPDALFIIDIKREIIAIHEAVRKHVETLAVADTNADPNLVDYPIPANDDAVGSIQFIVNYIVDAYLEGKKLAEKKEGKGEGVKQKSHAETEQEGAEPKKEEMEKEKVDVAKIQRDQAVKTAQKSEEAVKGRSHDDEKKALKVKMRKDDKTVKKAEKTTKGEKPQKRGRPKKKKL